MRKTALNMVCELAQINKDIFFIGSDLSPDILTKFKEAMPRRSFMEGISEANVVGMAAGLAMEGKIPYVNTIATFLTRRSFEQIVIDLCLHNVKVRLIGNGGGLVYAPLGPTHQAIDDIAILRAIPNMTIVCPADADEMRRIMPLTVDVPGPVYIRLAKGYDPIVSSPEFPVQIGKAIHMKNGNDTLLVTTGICLKLALEAAEELKKEGLDVGILHYHTVKPFDAEQLITCAGKVPLVISIEEHNIIGGLGSAVAEILAESNLNVQFKRIGIPDKFADNYGSQNELMHGFSITSDRIKQIINEKLTLRNSN